MMLGMMVMPSTGSLNFDRRLSYQVLMVVVSNGLRPRWEAIINLVAQSDIVSFCLFPYVMIALEERLILLLLQLVLLLHLLFSYLLLEIG
jgi:hypothetical protein